MIQVGDLVRQRREDKLRGLWLVTELAPWGALCAQGSKRRWFYMDSLEKL